MEGHRSPKRARARLHRYTASVIGIPHPDSSLSLLWAIKSFGRDADRIEGSCGSLDRLASFDRCFDVRCLASIAAGEDELRTRLQGLGRDIVDGRYCIGHTASYIVFFVLLALGSDITFIYNRFLSRVIVANVGLNAAKSLFCVFDERERAVRRGMEKCLQPIVNVVEKRDSAGGVRVGDDVPLAIDRVELHRRRAGIEQPPINAVRKSLTRRKAIAGERRVDP